MNDDPKEKAELENSNDIDKKDPPSTASVVVGLCVLVPAIDLVCMIALVNGTGLSRSLEALRAFAFIAPIVMLVFVILARYSGLTDDKDTGLLAGAILMTVGLNLLLLKFLSGPLV